MNLNTFTPHEWDYTYNALTSCIKLFLDKGMMITILFYTDHLMHPVVYYSISICLFRQNKSKRFFFFQVNVVLNDTRWMILFLLLSLLLRTLLLNLCISDKILFFYIYYAVILFLRMLTGLAYQYCFWNSHWNVWRGHYNIFIFTTVFLLSAQDTDPDESLSFLEIKSSCFQA